MRERINEWRDLMRTKPSIEDPEVAAGRAKEQVLRTLVETNLKHKGAFCFLGKRVPSLQHRRKFEVDLIVLTKKRLHFLEVKNWSGELLESGGNWVQIRRSGDHIEHPNLTTYNSQKQRAVVEHLRSHGVELDSTYFSQKVIFMNQNLHMSPGIASNPDVVPWNRLNDYLSTQRGTSGASYAERLVHSVIALCLDSEKSSLVLDSVFHAMPKSDFDKARKIFSSLETWDKAVLHGGKVLAGDCLKLSTKTSTVDLKSLPSGIRCKISWTRSKVIGFMQALVTKIPLGKIRLPDKRLPIKPTDILKFHCAGEEKPREIRMRNVNLIARG